MGILNSVSVPFSPIVPSFSLELRQFYLGKMTRIAIASDHAGYLLKEKLKIYLNEAGYDLNDFGADDENPVDYPDFIRPAAASVAERRNDLGIVLGGSGNGEAMAANKVRGVRCAVCWNELSAKLAKEHNDANMIAIGARMVSEEEAIKIVDTWLRAEFQSGRHLRRIEKLEA
jgi:ribose 5-phosphate isomerase B